MPLKVLQNGHVERESNDSADDLLNSIGNDEPAGDTQNEEAGGGDGEFDDLLKNLP